MPRYLVVGLYLDQLTSVGPQRFAAVYETDTPEEAEEEALADYDPNGDKMLEVAGTVIIYRGRMEVVS